ncbi:MAG: ribosome small subunit-dependent GTPase A [Nitrospinae bacterium]|nr:ribosome small subunit-dependent GTPase A [Nitrospinota bacterium]
MTDDGLFPVDGIGRVIAHHGVRVRIETAEGLVVAWKPPRGSVWVVGDRVRIEAGRPVDIEPRRTELARTSSGGVRQPVAANLDRLFIVTACGESFREGLVDRFIVAARHAGIEPVVVLNKIDRSQGEEAAKAHRAWGAFGIPVYPVSARTGEGIDRLLPMIDGTLSALVGQSGVGKSSLANVLAPGADRLVGEVNAKTEQGSHTTSSSLLIPVAGTSGALIDAPGIRQFAPSEISVTDAALYFPGFENLSGGCRFRDCLHEKEPGCVVTAARDRGEIPDGLYESYLRLLLSVKEANRPSWEKGQR